MWQEVLAGLEPDRRRDLGLLAHLGSFDEELAAAALGRDVDLAALTAGFPLVSTGPGGRWEIHALWRPHLATVVNGAEVADARRRAALVLARAGETATAVRFLAGAGAWDDLTRVVVDALGADRPPVPRDVVASWLGQLPPEMAEGPLGRLLAAIGVARTDPAAGAARWRRPSPRSAPTATSPAIWRAWPRSRSTPGGRSSPSGWRAWRCACSRWTPRATRARSRSCAWPAR